MQAYGVFGPCGMSAWLAARRNHDGRPGDMKGLTGGEAGNV